MRTLVLDRGYQPQLTVSWQRAIGMLFTDKAEMVEQYDAIVRSVSLAMQVPSVVRLVRGGRSGRVRIRFSRMNVLRRDAFTCQYCGEVQSARELTLDHVLPRSRGGRTTWDNVVTACRDCNGHKANRTPTEARMTLGTTPAKPTWLPPRAWSVDPSTPDNWRPWLGHGGFT